MINRRLKTYTIQIYRRGQSSTTAQIVAYHEVDLKDIIEHYNSYMEITGKSERVIESYDILLKPRMPIEWRIRMYNKQRALLYGEDV